MDTVVHIVSWLPFRDACAARLVCRVWYDAVEYLYARARPGSWCFTELVEKRAFLIVARYAIFARDVLLASDDVSDIANGAGFLRHLANFACERRIPSLLDACIRVVPPGNCSDEVQWEYEQRSFDVRVRECTIILARHGVARVTLLRAAIGRGDTEMLDVVSQCCGRDHDHLQAVRLVMNATNTIGIDTAVDMIRILIRNMLNDKHATIQAHNRCIAELCAQRPHDAHKCLKLIIQEKLTPIEYLSQKYPC